MAQHVSLAGLKAILERHRANTPLVQKAIMRRVAARITREAVSNVNDDLVMKRTGGLMRYIAMSLQRIKETDKSLSIGLPKGERLAIIGRVQDEGATIKAKNWYTKPSKKNPTGTGPWLIFPRAGGDWWTGAGVVSMAKGIRPQFAMVKEVTLKPRFWFRGAVEVGRQNMGEDARYVMTQWIKNRGEVPDAL